MVSDYCFVSLKNEIDHVRSVLSMNGYPRSLVDKVKNELKKKKKQVDTTTLNEDPVATAIIPYVSTMSERIGKILWDYGIRTSFKNQNYFVKSSHKSKRSYFK